MGRYTGPACKQCRREQMKLFLKGERCFMAKCPIETGRPQPGGAGRRRKKTSDYGNQLREKQRLRRMFGLREGQFHNFFERAAKKRGITGETLLQMLELRVDNLVYRLGFAPSRRAARQFVRHGHVRVNGERANIPSMILKPGDSITVKDAKGTTKQHTVVVTAPVEPLKLFVSSGTLRLGATGTAAIRVLSVQGGVAPYTATVSGNQLTLTQVNATQFQMTPRAKGTATITVRDSKGTTATQVITVQ